MTRDELEFSISQYLDGTLAPAERDALETRLGSDAEARALYAEYESLQGVLADAPPPAVRWDALAQHISAAVAREPEPAQSYKLGGWLRPARVALAASVLLAGAIAFSVFGPGRGETGQVAQVPQPPATPVEPIRIVSVDPGTPGATGGDVDPAPAGSGASRPPLRVAIGPPASGGDENSMRGFAASVVQRPSKAVIVSAAPVGQDTPQTPF